VTPIGAVPSRTRDACALIVHTLRPRVRGVSYEPHYRCGERGKPLPVWGRIAVRAAGQGGIVGLAQLLAEGLTPRQVGHACELGRLTNVARGVYQLGRTTPDDVALRWIAHLRLGPGSAASHHTAAQLLGLEPPATDRLHFTLPGNRRAPKGVTVHVSRSLTERDVWRRKGLRVTSASWTLLDEATLLDPDRLAVMLVQALARGLTTIPRLEQLLDTSNGHHGTGRLAAAVAAESDDPGRGRTHAEMEAMFLPMLRALPGLPPYVRNEPLQLTPGETVVPDVWFPGPRVWLELDSRAWHEQRRTMDADRRKDQRAVALGCLPFRVTWRHLVREWSAVSANLLLAVRRQSS